MPQLHLPARLHRSLLVALLLSFISSQSAILKAPNIESNTLTLQNTASTAMISQLFSHTFTTAFSANPTFVFGSGYQESVQFIYEDFDSYEDGISSSVFYIRVVIGSSTPIYKFRVNYMAFEGYSEISVRFHAVSGSNNVSNGTGTGVREERIAHAQSFTQVSTTASTFLNSYFLGSNTIFSLKVSANVTSTTTYETVITVDSDTTISRLKFYVLFVDADALRGRGYYVNPTVDIALVNMKNAANSFFYIYQHNATDFMICITGFQGDSGTTSYLWGWAVASTTGTNTSLTIDKLNFISVYFSVLQIGVYESVVTVEEGEGEGGVGVGAIGGAVSVVVVVAVVVVVVVYVRRRRQGKLMISGTPSLVSINQLPDLSF